MRIPTGKYAREEFYADLISRAFESRPDRISVYNSLKSYYLWGNNSAAQPVEYNKLYSHIDLLASFLFSGETTSFVIEVDEDEDGNGPQMERARKLTPAVNKAWHRANLDLVFNESLIWSLVYSTMFIKFVPKGSGAFDVYAVEPHAIGVLLEHEPMLDKQPVIVHEFFITKSDIQRRISNLPPAEQEMLLKLCTFSERQIDSTTTAAPTGMNSLIIAATSPNIQGNVINPIATQYSFNAKITEEVCTAQEVWVWDEGLAKPDYRVALMLEGMYLLHDSEKNPFVDNEQPFIKLTPNQIYNYFWGRTEMMYLIPLQEWVNERIPEIKKHLQKQTNPPKSVSGGFQEEKLAALDNPGGLAWDGDPSAAAAKVTEHFPAPINVFDVLDRADQIFAEISGIRDLMQGKGESGVRAMSHANLLVRVGSSRVKKKAATLEDAVEKVGHLILKIMQKYDATHYRTAPTEEHPQGVAFAAGQLQGSYTVKVDSHSSSPIFVEQQMDKAQLLFKAGAIDREDLIDAVKPQNPGILKKKLRIREAAAAKEKQAEQLQEQEKEKSKAEKGR